MTAREVADGIMDRIFGAEWPRNDAVHIADRAHIESALLAAERRGLEALTAPVEGMAVQEALDYLRAGTEAYGSYPGDIATVYDETHVRIAALIERISSALAAERAEKERLAAAARTITGWREHDYPDHFDRWTAQYLADRYRATLSQERQP